MSGLGPSLDLSYYEEANGTEIGSDDIDAHVVDDAEEEDEEDEVEFSNVWRREQDAGDQSNSIEDEDDDDNDEAEIDSNRMGSMNMREPGSLEREEDEEEEVELDPDLVKSSYFTELRKLELKGLLEIGNLLSWEVSSAKQGCGKEKLREDDPDTYWQSDGVQPHVITIHFAKKVSILTIAMFTNYPLDESYTPSEILIRAGTGEHDLQDVVSVKLEEPSGWSYLGLDQVLKLFLVKIIINGNHQNGKDTHIRSLKLFQPLLPNRGIDNFQASYRNDLTNAAFEFTSVRLQSESCIR